MSLIGELSDTRITKEEFPFHRVSVLVPGQAGDSADRSHGVAEVDDLQFTLLERALGLQLPDPTAGFPDFLLGHAGPVSNRVTAERVGLSRGPLLAKADLQHSRSPVSASSSTHNMAPTLAVFQRFTTQYYQLSN
ncbi:hypothetical protein [Nocardia pseudovaccinii]|uniref:hypothetical protein n=1 Tax=Nocardia pseudovaccinii TaxID=189540 RepID=UPI0012F497DF|nr:hypothetical protein [Nocardia pseudovaccinii]